MRRIISSISRTALVLGLALAACAVAPPAEVEAQYQPLAPTSARHSAETRRIDSLYAVPATVYVRNDLRRDVRALEAREDSLVAKLDSVRAGQFPRHALNDALDSLAAERRNIYMRVAQYLEWGTPAQQAYLRQLLASYDSTYARERALVVRADSIRDELALPDLPAAADTSAPPVKPVSSAPHGEGGDVRLVTSPPTAPPNRLRRTLQPDSLLPEPSGGSTRAGPAWLATSSAIGYLAGYIDRDAGGYADSWRPGVDKQAHTFGSALIGRQLTDVVGAGWGLASCVAAGAALELGQRRDGGYASRYDLAYDVGGCALGTAWSPRGRRSIARAWRAVRCSEQRPCRR